MGISLRKLAQMFPDEDCAVSWIELSFWPGAINARFAKRIMPTRPRMRQSELSKENPT